MRPVTIADISKGLVTPDTLLLLKTSTLGLRYATQLLTRNDAGICLRSKGGITLPNEIWTMILDFIREGTRGTREGTRRKKDKVCLVKADLVAASPNTMLLRCFRHKFDHPADEMFLIGITDSRSVEDFEDYLACATPSAAEKLGSKLPKLDRLSGPDNTFDVVLDTKSADLCLYTFEDAADFIATIDDGDCWVCGGERFICPGCTGGVASRFDAFMGCGVDLACPLCMGIEFSAEHKRYLEYYYHEEPVEKFQNDMREEVEDRLEELGYPVYVPDGAWIGEFGGAARENP
ncbi:hypothetical protein F5Y00DRAFT_244318 [Daldinia vernicosa]|uniref:uncharacterized protein n=1 Tax=Daldinia vernicosa TaxID=114800 RepID=UPI002007F5EE|nr:uncharacterized protein F5Y00DRAFT_244318 [Daldinia vernicosa]KAI0846203.1 hypothetical protein F5Y00DRAFT_244318 [Daldinia vernicosa]